MQLTELVNIFSEFEYPRNPDTGLTDIPAEDIAGALREKFPLGYEWRPFQVGERKDGRAFFVGTLTVRSSSEDGSIFSHTCVGAADEQRPGSLSYSGLSTMALRNAVLRGLGMGESIYNREIAPTEDRPVEAAPAPFPAASTPALNAPSANPPINPGLPPQAPSQGGYGQRFAGRRGGSQQPQGGYQNGNGGSPRPYGPWTGQIPVKSGEWAGTMYCNLPENVIFEWVAKGVKTAVLEMQRRQAAGNPAMATVAASPFANY